MNDLTPTQRQVLELLAGYRTHNPRDEQTRREFSIFAAAHADCCKRTLNIGHFTGSAWLVSADGERVLLTHHRKLGRWLQLGGHADGEGDLAKVALREAEEESGLVGLSLNPEIFDLDRHTIPARGAELTHWHYDVRFAIRALGGEQFAVSDESHDLAWRSVSEIVNDAEADESLRRMGRKWLGRKWLGWS